MFQIKAAISPNEIPFELLELDDESDTLEVQAKFQVWGKYYPPTDYSPEEYPEIELKEVVRLDTHQEIQEQLISPELKTELEEKCFNQYWYELQTLSSKKNEDAY